MSEALISQAIASSVVGITRHVMRVHSLPEDEAYRRVYASTLYSLLANPEYREKLGIYPKIYPDHIKCLIVDDAPFQTEKYNWRLRVLMGNFLQTIDMHSEKARLSNAYAYFNADMKPCFFDAGPKDGFPEDMRACGEKLTALGVENEVYIPNNQELPHGFLNLARTDSEAAECERRIIAFMDRCTKMEYK